MKSVKEQILEFLQQNKGRHHGGFLQRTAFKTKGGGFATGDNIKRRLNELVKEGKIFVDYEKGQAVFSAEHKPKMKMEVRQNANGTVTPYWVAV